MSLGDTPLVVLDGTAGSARASDDVRAQAEDLTDLVENALVGLHCASPNGVILWANQAELELLGCAAPEYVGRAMTDFHVDHGLVADILARLSRGEAVHEREALLRAKDGSIKHVLISANACFRDGRFVHSRSVTRDITESKQVERVRAAAADRTARLIKITAAIAGAVTEAEVFEALVDDVAVAANASTMALWLVRDDGRTAWLARSFGYTEATRQSLAQLSLAARGSSPIVDAIIRGEPVWMPSQDAMLEAYPQMRDLATLDRPYRVSCLPLIARGRVVGALGLTVEDATDASEEEQGFLLLVSWYAGQALERVRLLSAERESRKVADTAAAQLGLLSRASRAFATADFDLSTRVREIARELGAAVGGCAAISLLGRDGQLVTAGVHHPVREAHYAVETLVATTRLRIGEGISAAVVATGESVIVQAPDARTVAGDNAPAYRAFLARYPIYAMMCAPLRVGNSVIGTVTAMRVRADETYDRKDLLFLEELADRAAPAIENSRLHQENLSALSRTELVYQFAKSVVSAEKVEDVFEAALDAIGRGLGSTRGAILICDAHGVMRFRASRNLSAEYRAAVEGHSPWPPDAAAPDPVLVPDVEAAPAMRPFLPVFQREGIRSLAFVPLLTRGRLIGKFMVYFAERHTYTSHEIELASAIAHHLASVTARFAAIAKLEETIRYNELFDGVLAHDLRNPLGAMMTAAQLVLMRQEGHSADELKPVSRIIASGQRMFRMVDQLLDLTRIRSGGGIQLEPRSANLVDLCEQAIGELEVAHPAWIIQREAVGDPHGEWDPDRLLQIVSNLVSNAGQHGRQGSPIVVSIDGGRTDAVALVVRNEGVIPDAAMQSLFDPLRGTAERHDYVRGLGLGLFIVKEIVEAHGGTVQAASSADAGTAFTVTLPRRSPRSAAFERTGALPQL